MGQDKKIWNIKEMLDWTTQYLSEKKFENPRTNVEWLLSHILGCKRLDLYVNFDRPLNKAEIEKFKALLKRRLTNEPLQYIVGSTEFMGLKMDVNPSVLIPRPDTETLVEKTLDACQKLGLEKIHITDIGTGSGAVAIALGHFLKKAKIDCQLTAIDINEEALRVARSNAARADCTIEFLKLDILKEPIPRSDILVSNPPYISETEFLLLDEEVRNFEPREALWADDNGLAFYKRIIDIANHQKVLQVLVEVGYDQAQKVARLFKEKDVSVEIYKDYQGTDRVVHGILGHGSNTV